MLTLVGQDGESTFYARQAERHGGPVLMLGCANGRIAFHLAARGHSVLGVDPSKVMIQSAEERRSEADSAERLRFLSADLRALRLSERFPLVVAPQNALSLMTSVDDVLLLFATVRHHLALGGAFVFDVANPGTMLGRRRGDAEPPPHLFPEPARSVFTPHLRERRRAIDGRDEWSIRRLKLRHFEPDELDACLLHGGLVALERYGAFDGKPFDETDAVQIVVAAAR